MVWGVLVLMVACSPSALQQATTGMNGEEWAHQEPLAGILPPPGGSITTPSYDLTVGVVVPGQPLTFTASGAPPNDTLLLGFSMDGVGQGDCLPLLSGACLGMRPAVRRVPGTITTDALGQGSMTVNVPNFAALGIAFQSGSVATGQVSNVWGTSVGVMGTSTDPSLDRDMDGYTPADGDCDDHDSATFPGAPDGVGDNIDRDCDGYDEGMPTDTGASDTGASDTDASDTGSADTGSTPPQDTAVCPYVPTSSGYDLATFEGGSSDGWGCVGCSNNTSVRTSTCGAYGDVYGGMGIAGWAAVFSKTYSGARGDVDVSLDVIFMDGWTDGAISIECLDFPTNVTQAVFTVERPALSLGAQECGSTTNPNATEHRETVSVTCPCVENNLKLRVSNDITPYSNGPRFAIDNVEVSW